MAKKRKFPAKASAAARPKPAAESPSATTNAPPVATDAAPPNTSAGPARRPQPDRRPAAAARTGTRPEKALTRVDFGAAAGVGVISAAVFATTFSSRVALGDSPESIAGVRSLGVLHAPGYVAYVVAARVFGKIVRVGSWSLRVNLFSLVCAACTIALLYLVARGFGSDRIGAVVGSLALATSVTFWFNAGFAKYYACSSLLLVVVVICVQRWLRGGSPSLLVGAGVLTGAGLGVSWLLAAVVALALIALVWFGPNRPGRTVVIATAGATVLAAVAVCVFVVVRAGQDPTVNFGHASNVARLRELLAASDFSSLRQSGGAGVGNFVKATPMYVEIVARDAGLGAALLALVGIFDVWNRRRRDLGLFLAILGLGNLVGVGVNWGYNTIAGFTPGLVMGGQLVGVYVVVAVLAALGLSRLGHEVREWRVEARRSARRAAIEGRDAVVTAVVAVVAAATIVPSLVVHHELADHRMPPLAGNYAARVLAQLPRHAVLLSGGYEFAQPVIERQEVDGARRDVTVIALDILDRTWYRDQLVHRLGLDPALARSMPANTARAEVVTALRRTRPVFEDAYAMYSAPELFGYQPQGLVGRVVDGSGPQSTPGVAALAVALRRGEDADGIDPKYNRFPNATFFFLYERAHVELAKADALAGDLDHAADEIERGLVFEPKQEDRTPITLARKHDPNAKRVILGL